MGRTITTLVERSGEFENALRVASEAVGLVIEYLDREAGQPQERRGGYFCYVAATPAGASLLVHAKIGLVCSKKEDKYRAFSLEKAARLAGRPGDRSSWQTRDEAHDQYGGAIRCKSTLGILSFSGLPEHGDEAAMLLVAIRLGDLAPHDASNIGSVSGNATYAAIMAEFERAGCWNDGNWTVPQE